MLLPSVEISKGVSIVTLSKSRMALSSISAALFPCLISFFVIPWSEQIHRKMFLVVAFLAGIFLVLGIALIYQTWKLKWRQKWPLVLVGGSAAFFLISVLLHNFMYALAILTENSMILHATFEFLHAAFFILGIIGCPIAFIVGVVGYFVKERKK